ncbi:hypothetical protein BU24DRAFT_491691 [Aaosphaeria arxii CBS 175.79]|uniref:Uncharacterized protein n=1 Tax=Aaosphaeria arxii CBS 175.79 TaxID=1450172 RepID=A0A6A5XRI5_9PLEO|nr:uncharacterized protein BU24DRAFT_491691 [Aaosphaeria arxii CBS 175.79]KAF2015447.1 hypothetical protein BU24DRAFT_491691 [Aaosphaeria arxii CBS 175.79]
MPNVLVLSFEGFSFSARQLYQQLLPKLLSRASLHESTTIQDALNYISTGWPNVILITDSAITRDDPESRRLLDAVVECTKHGCTAITIGFFASTVHWERLDSIIKDHFHLRWQVTAFGDHEVQLYTTDENLVRTSTLARSFQSKALFLGRVPNSQLIYSAASTPGTSMAYAAIGRVGLGKYCYLGDQNFGDEPERLILAMCHLDRPEDAMTEMDD